MNFLAAAYIIIMCVFLPLYMKEGYYKLGEAKGLAFLWISSIFLVLSILGAAAVLVRSRVKGEKISKGTLVSGLRNRAFLLAFIASSLISLIFSMDKKIAFFGLDGWRTGFMTWGFAALLALVISIFGIGKRSVTPYITAISLFVPFCMFLLGIANRFGIYPLPIAGRNNSYLATLGNINWYTGFLSVFVPLGVGLSYREKRFSKGFFLCSVYELVGLAALFLQGSESALLIVAATYILLAFSGFRDRERFKDFLCRLFVLGTAMELSGLLYLVLKESYTYEDSMLVLVCAKHVGLIVMAAAVVLYRLGCFFGEIKVSFKKNIYRYILFGVVVTGGVFVLMFVANNFSDDFGNGRGIIWRLSSQAFARESFFQKLVGVGQDCYFTFIRSDKELSHAVHEAFDGARLTNAHCELLTVLIQTGFLGAVTYLGLICSSILELMLISERSDKEADRSFAIVFALPIAAYFLNSLVSFPQTVSTPYVFICIGIALKIISDHKLSRSSS